MKIFSKNNFNILTTKEIFEGQRFAIIAIFLIQNYKKSSLSKIEKIVAAPDLKFCLELFLPSIASCQCKGGTGRDLMMVNETEFGGKFL